MYDFDDMYHDTLIARVLRGCDAAFLCHDWFSFIPW